MWNHWIRAALLAALLALSGCSYVATKYASVIPTAGVNEASLEVMEKHRQAIGLMQANQWEEAGLRLQYLTERYPQHAGPWLNLGIVQMKLANRDAATAAFRAAISRNPDIPVGYNSLGILYRQSGQPIEALAMYQSALRVAPDYPDTHWNIAILYELSLADPGHALQHYLRYQALTGSKDPQLQTWIDILRNKTVHSSRAGA